MNQRRQFKILQITRQKFPPEIRVAKEGLSFHEAGYQSAVLCPPMEGQEEHEIWEGIEIFRPSCLRSRSFFDKLASECVFFSPAWFKAIRNTIKTYEPDVLHVHDIWLGRVTLAASGAKKIVTDLHENMPAAVIEYRKGYRSFHRLFRYIFHNQPRILSYERHVLQKSDLVLCVVKEARDRVIENHQVLNSDSVVNVENLESKRFISNPNSGKRYFGKDHISVLYIGGFGPHRGIDTLIRAMVLIREKNLNYKVQIVGAKSSQYLGYLKELIHELQVEDYVQITGWVPTEDVHANIQQADICCVPHHSNPHTDSTIPHKLFQYMIARKPVLVSSSRPLARTVDQAQAGLVFEAGNPADCAEKIISLGSDSDKRAEFADNGICYVMQEGHNWEDESAPILIEAFDRLVGLS